MNSFRKVLGTHSEVALVVLVIGILLVLFAPIPSLLLDFLIIANISFALLILLLTFYIPRPVEFSTFPSILLIATLFRLALNIAATRLILTDADAGQVISAVGSYVVAGNYVVGLIVFLILIVVQYVVVTSGAQRVSEVAARFTLDSMPGQQMAIDADLNMGLIDQDEAKARRKNIEKEASFYGSMDGASKFVKGDAIAGIIILLINIIGGLIIGVMQLEMGWEQALQTYSLLTVGDGIVTQIPALVISVGTGIIVTRSASDLRLSNEVAKQLTAVPKTLFLVLVCLFFMAFLPGIPVWPVVVMALLFAALTWVAWKKSILPTDKKTPEAKLNETLGTEVGASYADLTVEAIVINMGKEISGQLTQEHTLLATRISAFRKQFALETGLVIPEVKFRTSEPFAPNAYEIQLFAVKAGKGELFPGRVLAIHPAGDTKSIAGIVTREPTYGLPAVWIEDSQKEKASAAKFTLVDAETVFVTHLMEVIRQQCPLLLNRVELEKIIERVRSSQAGLVEDLIPAVLSISDLQRILQNLLREKVSIRHIEAILETLSDAARGSKDLGHLTEMVRQRLGLSICQSLMGEADELHVLTLDSGVENQFFKSLQVNEKNTQLLLNPMYVEQFLSRLTGQAERMMKSSLLPILLCSPELRRHVRGLSERVLPQLRILSMSEIPATLNLKSFGSVVVPSEGQENG